MKKIVLSEPQADRLMNQVISEQLQTENRYSQKVKSDFDYHGMKYNGNEIDWIDNVEFTVSFDIHVDARSYGIKDINVMNVRGPEAIEAVVIYYPEGSEDSVEDTVELKLNWDDVKVENDADIGWIGIDHEVEINLTSGQIVVHSKEI